MNELQPVTPISVDNIKSKIHEIRGQKVMLDFDLALLYQVETKRLKEAVKRNIERFPNDAMFVLTEAEFATLRSQFATSNKRGVTRYLPFAFTELGISMLSSVLSSNIAIKVNLQIMRTFIALKHFVAEKKSEMLQIENLALRIDKLNDYIESVLRDQNDINDDTATQLELINQTLAELQAENAVRKTFQERKPVGFKIEKP